MLPKINVDHTLKGSQKIWLEFWDGLVFMREPDSTQKLAHYCMPKST